MQGHIGIGLLRVSYNFCASAVVNECSIHLFKRRRGDGNPSCFGGIVIGVITGASFIDIQGFVRFQLASVRPILEGIYGRGGAD